MGKSMRDTLHSILDGTDYTSTRNVRRQTISISTEYIFVKHFVNARYDIPKISIGEDRNMINDFSTTISNANKSICDGLKIFKQISVYRKIEGMNFNSIYRNMLLLDNGECMKWVSKDGTYYVCSDKIFDEGKKLLMFISMNNKIIVDSSCINSDKWLEKYIVSTFVPVYNDVYQSDVVFTDLSEYTPSFDLRHDIENMNNRLNNKLHYFSKTSYLG